MKNKKNMQNIVNHLKATGFVFQGSEIYGGLANTWDYGPLGVLLTKKVKDYWWKVFIRQEINNYALDSKILMNNQVWKASGHIDNFTDALIENKINKKRYRADHLIEELFPEIDVTKLSKAEMAEILKTKVPSYDNSKTDWSDIREFNLMFQTQQGVLANAKDIVYLRPETAQGIFVNFKNITRSMRAKLPLGIGQIGKSFRNEVTPGNFIFRTREFEQMELEIFVNPNDDDQEFTKYLNKMQNFLLDLGINESSIRIRHHKKEELAHYSKATSDIEFKFPFGWGELLGVANRGNFDLTTHMLHSKENLEYRDPITNETFIPFVIEPSIGLDRLTLALISDAFEEEKLDDENTRIVLKLDKKIAPYHLAILPLTKKQSQQAKEIFDQLIKNDLDISFDEAGSIGKRYRRQDAIGTPYCITVDYDTENDQKVTIRNRDTMQQERVEISGISNYIK
ncbi:glycine--tRNA ligase [Mycoplasma iguanae]|uniref:Glycine--tRNA ligase n=1 Tax=Mycoplasma iguanae TaxID=292461 RepID=A0ABY5R9Y1_9MOLU|nr:glycine--tRNA ligase [Mycoplasma iguanae]UVD81992.1 glycine--tRNA ligase [Mycoplasma iguanae]